MSKDEPDHSERLAEALRANLRRRKAQRRELQPPPDPGSGTPSDDLPSEEWKA